MNYKKLLIPMQKKTQSCHQPQPQNLNKFNRSSKPLPSLHLPKDLQILSLQLSTDGHGGVIFIQLPEGAFVLKPTVNIPRELFYNRMAGEMGIRVAQMEVFGIQGEVYGRVMQAICRYCRNRDEILLSRIRSRFTNLFYSILPYIPSTTLQQITPQKFTKILQKSPQKIHQLGVCLGFDMIINNNDRFQFLLGGDGNLGNILIQVIQGKQGKQEKQAKQGKQGKDGKDGKLVEYGGFVFIDNQGNMCDVGGEAAANVKWYMDKVVTFVTQALHFLTEPDPSTSPFLLNPSLQKFLSHLHLFTQFSPTPNQTKQLLSGLRDALDIFIHCHKTKKIHKIYEKIMDIQKLCADRCSGYLKRQWERQLGKVCLEFCGMMVDRVQGRLREHYGELRRRKEEMVKIEKNCDKEKNRDSVETKDKQIEQTKQRQQQIQSKQELPTN